MEIKSGFPEYKKQDSELREKINSQISSLLKKGVLLSDIAKILNAEEFLEKIETGKNKPPVDHFNVEGFVEKYVSKNKTIDLPKEYIRIKKIILPPSELELKTGSEKGLQELKIIPRSIALMELLSDLKIEYSVIEGENSPNMMRKLSYLAFILPSMGKMVIINDEEGNATFIIHELKPNEWESYLDKTKLELSNFSYNKVSFLKYPDKNKESHLETWKDKIKKLILENPQESTKSSSSKIGEAPKGWITMSALAKKLEIDPMTLKKRSGEYKISNPDQLKKYENNNGTSREYYSPELVKIILDDYEKLKSAPKGWTTIGSFCFNNEISLTVAKEVANGHRKDYPEWFKFYKDKSGNKREHLHPELLSIIRKENGKSKGVPTGWFSAYSVKEEFGINSITFKRYTDEYRKIKPKWFMKGQGRTSEYYSPELIKIVVEKYKKFKTGPIKGWLTINEALKEIKISKATLRDFIKKYKSKNPEWFKMHSTKSTGRELNLHPDLIKLAKEKFSDEKLAPDGWLTFYSVAKKFGSYLQTIRKYAEPYRKIRPEWFKEYENNQRRPQEFCSPELVKILKEKLTNSPPKGWLSLFSLAKSLKIDQRTIEKQADIYKQKNPEWFGTYRSIYGSMSKKHYSPELIAILRKKFETMEQAPEGWETMTSLGKQIRVDKKKLRKYSEKYRLSNPNYFKNYKHKTGIREYYSPELVDLLKKEFA